MSNFLDKEDAADAAEAMPGVVAASGLRDRDSVAALLHFIAERRTLLPTTVEVLPFLCSFADRLRHTFDNHVEVVVVVDRECPAWKVDRRALEDALMQVVLSSGCAALRMGRLTLQASLDRRSPKGSLLKLICSPSTKTFSWFEWQN